MMKLQQSQKGATLTSIAFYLALLAFAVFTTLKLFPVYMESYTVESSVKGLETDRADYMGVLAVRKALMKRLSVNNVTIVDKDDITVIRDEEVYNVEVDYEVRIPFVYNIDLVLSFNHQAEVSTR